MKILSIAEVEYMAYRLAKEFMTWNEPIPDFSSRFPNILESCLVTPFQEFRNQPAYKGFTQKAAALFYFMVKNHPFKNGNKRIAMTTLFCFLYENKKWMNVDNQKLYNFAKWVAESDSKVKTETIAATDKFIKTFITDL